jgi:hypothetical protein
LLKKSDFLVQLQEQDNINSRIFGNSKNFSNISNVGNSKYTKTAGVPTSRQGANNSRNANKSKGTSNRKPEMLVTPVEEETSAAVGTAAIAETLAKAGTKKLWIK